ncbi:S8 family peptidase [Shewanella intestini]|uniref:S8 family peptidase n=1 Tax=Shewanella intestini TaxID=2017544 RepID=A0ABS5I3G5_9GAMM|nr:MULTISPECIES: S8 family peptidase [Shewanella]MBR9727930.1 S8 family peptidase [Shewanella intestini]MRG36519.1 S8 family serine peptidase [Shewanella sp. XMDDZSB0408]
MKIKTVTFSVLAAIYTAGVGAAYSTQKADNLSQAPLQQLQLSYEELQKLNEQSKKQTTASGNLLKRANQKNVHLTTATKADKFTFEQGLEGTHTYIVQLADAAVTTYNGGIEGYQATSIRANAGQVKLFNSTNDNNIAAYKKLLLDKQQSFVDVARVQGINLELRQQYTTAINGFSTNLTQQQAQLLSTMPQVLNVKRSGIYELHTDIGPQIIGADQIWTGNSAQASSFKGEGILVGVIDTGINSDHPSFQSVGDDGYAHINPFGEGVYVGDCAIEEFADMCNDKLVGIRSYDVITDVYSAPEFQGEFWNEWDIPVQIRPANGEDYNGHGSHTAGTTVGNVLHNVPHMLPQIGDGDGTETGLIMGTVSGVAPHANLISYQACYPGNQGDAYSGCPGEALISAIEDAIEDGVDVINFSIGGSESFPWNDPFELAFLSAREAGIVVSASAGNSGTDGYNEFMSSADHTSPWLLTVGATTTGRTVNVTGKELTDLSGGDTTLYPNWQSAGISAGVSGNIVLAENYGDKLCEMPFAADTFTADQIVVCERGNIARIEKANNVAAGGAGGFVLYNTQWNDTLDNDVYVIPGVHIDYNAQYSLIPWLQSGTGHMATITASTVSKDIDPTQQDQLADFSSRGPSLTNPEHLIPSISAPGVDIYAANADEHPFSVVNLSSKYASLSGTSMAAPHVAGAAALIKQARPDWTASEIQSAIMMTAHTDVTTMSGQDAGIYRAGSGRINALAAIDAGLLMDETADNFMLANPNNGGTVRALNLPEMVNFDCKQTCSWVRTFKATHDGTWAVETETGEYSVELKATPATFSLKKGDKVSVVFEAKILDSQTASNNSEAEVHAKVMINEVGNLSAASFIPVAIKYNHGTLPERVKMMAHRNNDSAMVKGLSAPSFNQLTVNSYAPTKATMHEVILPQDVNEVSPFYDGLLDESTQTLWVDVPANTTRFITEVLSRDESTAEVDWQRGDLDMIIGIDANEDGQVQMDEAICFSYSSTFSDYCNINHPNEGKYWVVLHNWKSWSEWDEYARPTDTYTVASAVVSNDLATDVVVTGPQSHDGVNAFDLNIEWNKDMVKGDLFYGAFDLGADELNPGNLGLVPYRLMRDIDEVHLHTSQTQAKAGDVIDVEVSVNHNNTGTDREFALSTMVPAGLTILAETVNLSSSTMQDVTVTDREITVVGTQHDTSSVAPQYLLSTSLDDMMCKTPSFGIADHDGGYLDLQTKADFLPSWGGIWDENLTLQLSSLFDDDTTYSMYNNTEYNAYPSITISPQGYLQFDELPLFFPFHLPFPMGTFPDTMIAPLWKGVFFGASFGTPYEPNQWEPELNAGITFAYTQDKQMIIEWDNVRSQMIDYDWFTGTNIINNMDDRYDFQTIINFNDYQYGEGQYEIIMAYDNLDMAGETQGTIGVHGFSGVRSTYQPIEGYKGTQFAFDDIDQKLSNDLVVCYDYVGPEMSQMKLTFQARVDNNSAGNALEMSVNSQVDGIEDMQMAQSITVAGNLTLGDFKDYTIDENTQLADVVVAYSDANNSVNTITVTGENITSEVNSHTPGSTFTVTPAANFYGETEVTVTVYDTASPTDMVSKSFMLTVISDGVELGCTDPAATNYDENANQDSGDCTYPADDAEEESSNDSGGAVHWIFALFILMAINRRKRA